MLLSYTFSIFTLSICSGNDRVNVQDKHYYTSRPQQEQEREGDPNAPNTLLTIFILWTFD